MLHSHLSGWPGRYHSGCTHVYTATDSEETHPPSPTKLQPSDTCAARIVSTLEQAVLWGQLLLSQCSPASIASSGCVIVLFTHHQPASASPAVEHREGSEAGVKRGQNWWGGALLAALSHKIFNFKLFHIRVERSGYSDTLFKFCIQCCVVTASGCSHPAQIQQPQRPVWNTPCPNPFTSCCGWQAHYKKATEGNALLEKLWMGSCLVMKGNEQELPAE